MSLYVETPGPALGEEIRSYRRLKAVFAAAGAGATRAAFVVRGFAGVAVAPPARLLATAFPSLALQARPLSGTELTVLLHLRLPRIVMALLAGIGLAVSGLVMQAITGNTMASPFTTGLSNAAAMGAAVVIVFGLNFMGTTQLTTVFGAFVLAFLCAALVYGISSAKGLGSTTIANEQQLTAIVNWTFGSLSQSTWPQILFTAAVLGVSLPILFSRAWHYNLLTTGDESAVALGVNVGRLRCVSGLLITLIAATVVSFTGVIGFVGLVAPHIARLLVGGDHRVLFPVSALLGGCLLILADLVGRTVASPVVIPVGIVVSFIGVPVFVYLILRDRKERVL